MRPAGQLPTGLPTEPIVQSGSSITPTFIAVMTGLVVATGALAYVLTRDERPEPAHARRVRRNRSVR